MIYLEAVLFAGFSGFFAWEEASLSLTAQPLPFLAAGAGWLISIALLLSTLRRVFGKRR